METQHVSCEVRTQFLNIKRHLSFELLRINWAYYNSSSVHFNPVSPPASL
jgi:hypothetical protein